MKHLPWVAALLAATLVACGGDDDDSTSADDTTPAGSANTAPAGNTTAPGGSSGSSGDAGTARITVGDESFEFDVTCQFGTGIITGAGENDEGTEAFAVLSMPKDERGQPVDNPEEVGLNVTVGRSVQSGPSLYQYRVTDTLGSVSRYSDDGKHTEGVAEFVYEDKDGSRDGLSYGDVVTGEFEATCP